MDVKSGSAAQHSIAAIMRDGLSYVPSAIVPAILALASTAVFTRLFPPSQYGIFTLMGAVTGPILSVTAQPTAQAANRFLAEYDHQGRWEEYRQALSWLTVLTMAVMIVLSATALALWPLLHSRSVDRLVLSGTLMGLVASVLFNILTPVLNAAIKVREFNLVMITSETLSLGLPILLILLLGHHIAWLLWGNALAVLAVLPWLVARADILRPLRAISGATRQTVARFVRYGSPMALWFFGSSMLNLGDRYIIQAFHGSGQVGLYGANYAMVIRGVGLIAGPVLTAVGPRLLRQWAEGDVPAVRKTMSRMTSVYLLLGGALVGLVAVAGRALASVILARSFLPGAAILVPVTAGSVIWGVSRIGHKSMEFRERNPLMVWDVLAATGVNFGLNILFIPRYGFVAAGYTTLIAYVVYSGLVWWQARRLIPWDIVWTDVLAYIVAGAGGCAVVRLVIPSPVSLHALPVIAFIVGASVLFLAVYGALVSAWFWMRRESPLTWLRT